MTLNGASVGFGVGLSAMLWDRNVKDQNSTISTFFYTPMLSLNFVK